MEFHEFSQLKHIPPFNIKKVDSINFFNNERNESSINSSNHSNFLMSERRKGPSLVPRTSSQVKRSYLEKRASQNQETQEEGEKSPT